MNCFLPMNHLRSELPCGLLGGIICLLLVLSLRAGDAELSAIFIALIVLLFIIARRLNRCGLYILGDHLLYQSFTKKKLIIPTSIVAIKKSVTLFSDLYSPFHPMKSKEGKTLYTAILVNSIDSKMPEHKDGDMRFLHEFRKQVICRCRYDQSAVDALLRLNPNAVVWD